MSKFLRKFTFFALKAMGLKRIFSQDPIPYLKLRKTDKKNPPKHLYKKYQIERKEILESTIYSARKEGINSENHKLIIFIPGGAFVSGPAQHHWDAVHNIVEQCNVPVWLLIYPKAPEFNIQQFCQNVDLVFNAALEVTTADHIIFIGDSVGGNLILTLVQRLIINQQNVPSTLILITPVLDASMTNLEIDDLVLLDPIVNKKAFC